MSVCVRFLCAQHRTGDDGQKWNGSPSWGDGAAVAQPVGSRPLGSLPKKSFSLATTPPAGRGAATQHRVVRRAEMEALPWEIEQQQVRLHLTWVGDSPPTGERWSSRERGWAWWWPGLRAVPGPGSWEALQRAFSLPLLGPCSGEEGGLPADVGEGSLSLSSHARLCNAPSPYCRWCAKGSAPLPVSSQEMLVGLGHPARAWPG